MKSNDVTALKEETKSTIIYSTLVLRHGDKREETDIQKFH